MALGMAVRQGGTLLINDIPPDCASGFFNPPLLSTPSLNPASQGTAKAKRYRLSRLRAFVQTKVRFF